jgi:uncharacterized membrane protein YtjA (UPF0391 family)
MKAAGPVLSGLSLERPWIEIKEIDMLRWAAGFFVIAIIAAIFGFGGVATGAADIAKVLFFVFLVVFFISVILGLVSGGRVRS